MLDFLNHFLRKKTEPVYIAPEKEKTAILTSQQFPNLPEQTKLIVPEGYHAVLLQGNWRSPVYVNGEYVLNKRDYSLLNPNIALSVVFLNMGRTISRQWISTTPYPIYGHYTLHLTESEKFISFLMQLRSTPSLTEFDFFLSAQIAKIMDKNDIPAEDVHELPQKLAHFLRDVLLANSLHDAGFSFVDLSIQLDKSLLKQPITTQSLQHNDMIDKTNEHEVDNKQTLPPPMLENNAPKEFYLVAHGEQIGPFSAPVLQTKIYHGEISPNTLLWKQGLLSWQPAKSFNIFQWNNN